MYGVYRMRKEGDNKISMDDGYSRLILLAGVVLFFLAAGVAIWRFIKSRQENVTEEDIMDMVNEGHEQGVWSPARPR